MTAWHSGHMPRENADHLAEAVEDLNQEVRVLREAIDELRETLQWVCQNKGAEQTYSTLKTMSRDVSAPSWAEHLPIESGPSAIEGQRSQVKTPQDEIATTPPAPTGDTLF